MTFSFSEEMIRTALEANGWSKCWAEDNWVHESFLNPDYSGLSTKLAFEILLRKSNLAGINLKDCWK